MGPFDLLNLIIADPNANPTSGRVGTVGNVLGFALNIFIGVAVSIAIICVILAGINFITSQGDVKALQKAKDSLTYSIVAIIVSVSGFAIKLIILHLFGSNEQNLINEIPTNF